MAASSDVLPLSGQDRLAIALVGLVHGCSHFFQLVLPPLFPFLIADFGVGYTELGLLMSVFFVASGIGQPIAGFLVDRFGARKILFLGLGIYTLGIMSLATLPAFWCFYVVMMLTALGNCVFHPVDFTILNASVRATHLGRAFSVHTLGGNIGWAIAPVFVLGVAELAGWRASLLAAGGVGMAVGAIAWTHREVLRDGAPSGGSSQRTRASIDVRVLLSATILLCFGYFTLLASAQIAVQNFIGPILQALHATSLVVAASALSAFLLGASAGVIVGGVAADRTGRYAFLIVAGLAGAAASIVALPYVPASSALLIGLLALAGFLSGMTTPSRDMLVRHATPPGATGRVFGFVYSGLDVGSALAPVTVGALLDHGRPAEALWLVGALLVLTVFTVTGIGHRTPASRPAT